MKIELKQALNEILANLNVMYMKLHHFHWFVKGPHFFVLHEKFEELYDELTAHVDEVAERMLTLQAAPISTLKECLELATVKEANGLASDNQIVEEVISDFEMINKQLSSGIDFAGDEDDEGTVDLLLGISKSLEKHMWMLRSYLGK